MQPSHITKNSHPPDYIQLTVHLGSLHRSAPTSFLLKQYKCAPSLWDAQRSPFSISIKSPLASQFLETKNRRDIKKTCSSVRAKCLLISIHCTTSPSTTWSTPSL
jgi:hypothetical protein